MPKYQIAGGQEFKAYRYMAGTESARFVQGCYADYRGVVRNIQRDLLGSQPGAFSGVLTTSGWVQIAEGDYIIVKGDERQVMTKGLFEMLGVTEVE